MPRPLRPLTPDLSPRHFLGALLREWRLKFRWSQLALGQRVGASASWISRIEKAERSAPADLLRRCDLVLGTGGLLARYGAAARDNSATIAQNNDSGTSIECSTADMTAFGAAELGCAFPAERRSYSLTMVHLNGRGKDAEPAHQPGGGDKTLTASGLRSVSSEAASLAMYLGELIERLFGAVMRARAEGLADHDIAYHLSSLGGPVAIGAALAADSDGTAIRFLVASLVAVPDLLGVAGADLLPAITTDEEGERV